MFAENSLIDSISIRVLRQFFPPTHHVYVYKMINGKSTCRKRYGQGGRKVTQAGCRVEFAVAKNRFREGETPGGSETGKFRWWKGERTEREERSRTEEPRETELFNERGKGRFRAGGGEQQ